MINIKWLNFKMYVHVKDGNLYIYSVAARGQRGWTTYQTQSDIKQVKGITLS